MRLMKCMTALMACGIAAFAAAAGPEPETDPAGVLQARYASLQQQLEHSPFGRDLHIESLEGAGALRGDVYAIVDYPFATIRDALTQPENWCDVLILHLNVKYCRLLPRDGRSVLSVAVGRKTDQPLGNAYRFEFAYGVTTSPTGYLQVDLDAPKGPLGTGNYRVSVEATALEGQRAFVHLGYAYTYGFWARVSTYFYLGGAGKGKVGFTVTDDPALPQPAYVGGLRGIVERNAMRYYLAVEAYLCTLQAPAPERFEQSIERWFDATERYSRQLHELDRDSYLAMKRHEYQRQQTE